MQIVDVVTQTFHYRSKTVRDSEGHGHPGPEHDATQTILKIITDEGVAGYAFGENKSAIDNIVKPLLVGADPLYREKLWQMLKERQRLHLATRSRCWTIRSSTASGPV